MAPKDKNVAKISAESDKKKESSAAKKKSDSLEPDLDTMSVEDM